MSEAGPAKASLLSAIAAQKIAFSPIAKIADVLTLAPFGSRGRVRVGVFRNHAVEPTLELVESLFSVTEHKLSFLCSDYDDSLAFDKLDLTLDAYLIWLDYSRYEKLEVTALAQWLTARLHSLRALTDGAILVVEPLELGGRVDEIREALRLAAVAQSSTTLLRLDDIRGVKALQLVDDSRSAQVGTRIAREFMLPLARHLAWYALPSALMVRLKAIIVDLDETLYKGVLGEDGVQNLEFHAQHHSLIQQLIGFADGGVFIAICSKNEDEDVEMLFSQRPELRELKPRICARKANWKSKAENVAQIIDSLNVGVDACLFLDDNVGELFAVKSALPDIYAICANAIPPYACEILSSFPRLHGYATTKEDRLRHKDFQANEVRKRLELSSQSLDSYLSELQPEFVIRINAAQDFDRLTQLSNKTNQFNFALRRLTRSQVETFSRSSTHRVVSVSYSDKLSDSGIVGLFVIELDPAQLRMGVYECAISCRSLGRGFETSMIAAVIECIIQSECKSIRFYVTRGERNSPALSWLAKFGNVDLVAEQGTVELDREKLLEAARHTNHLIRISVDYS
jgi:FkbH-like protein